MSNGDHPTRLVSRVTFGIDNKALYNKSYTYDRCGNINCVLDNGIESVRYHYDGVNRLIREGNKFLNFTATYAYDCGGNIINKLIYAYTIMENIIYEPIQIIPYCYNMLGNNDQLLSYDGESINYDVLENPTIYRGKSLKWNHVRHLSNFGDVSYTYKADGTRLSKTYNSQTIKYNVLGNKLMSENHSDYTLYYLYGPKGIIGFDHCGARYIYICNIQGDITHIYTKSGGRLPNISMMPMVIIM